MRLPLALQPPRFDAWGDGSHIRFKFGNHVVGVFGGEGVFQFQIGVEPHISLDNSFLERCAQCFLLIKGTSRMLHDGWVMPSHFLKSEIKQPGTLQSLSLKVELIQKFGMVDRKNVALIGNLWMHHDLHDPL